MDAPVDDAAARMLGSQFRHWPVVEQTEESAEALLVGIVSARDVLRRLRERLAAA